MRRAEGVLAKRQNATRLLGLLLAIALSFHAPAPSLALIDNVPPSVAGLTISPASVDATNQAQTVHFYPRLVDASSGISGSRGILLAPPGCTSGVTQAGGGCVLDLSGGYPRISGNQFDGVYDYPFTIAAYTPPGTWTVVGVYVLDNAGNQTSKTTGDLAAAGFMTTFQVTSAIDSIPPAIAGVTISPSSVDATQSAQTVHFYPRFTDNSSGIGGARYLRIAGPRCAGTYPYWYGEDCFELGGGTPRVSGNELDGVYDHPLSIAQYGEPGTWIVQSILVYDNWGNQTSMTTGELAAAGFMTTFVTDQIWSGPTHVSVDPGDASAIAGWAPAGMVGGTSPTSYSVEVSATTTASAFPQPLFALASISTQVASAQSISVGPDTTSATVSGLQNGTSYSVVVSAVYADGTKVSASPVSVVPGLHAPAITQQPLSATVTDGTRVSFITTASGVPVPSVRWQTKAAGSATWTDIAGATASTYARSATSGDDGRAFRAIFTNGSGSVTTGEAILNVISVISFSPTSGGPGTSVVITGKRLSGVTAVTFNGITSPAIIVKSATQVLAEAPAGASTGRIAVTVPTAGSARSATNFTWSSTLKAPTVAGMSPGSGLVGATVTITGTNFVGASAVKFGTSTATYTIVDATTAVAVVPAGASSGAVSVTTIGGTGASRSSFNVVTPSVLAYTGPTTAKPGVSVTLSATLKSAGGTGIGFQTVTFIVNGRNYTAKTSSSGIASVKITAPSSAGTFPISLSFAGSTAYGASTGSGSILIG